ncbi:MAG: metallophosphoesterase [Clostridia bacterium]|nr:metallophosphoesterase [Clostridia bacterium]MBR7034077.1 metallophosphoesterase [Clostridia bacterium]
MSVWSIADLHLSLSVPKPMDVFGSRWRGYTEKIEKNWRAVVKDGDTVVIPGDVSWAMRLPEAEADFRFIDSLPGKKIVGKGNHDLWWTTVSKMEAFLSDAGIRSIRFLYNNAFLVEGVVIAGTRGWFPEERLMTSKTLADADYNKLVERERIRLRASLEAGIKLREEAGLPDAPIFVYLHFPPLFEGFRVDGMMDLMREFGVTRCFFGHVHGNYSVPATVAEDGISVSIISADYLNFIPHFDVK